MSKMKLIMENWRQFITEAPFHDSPDEDGPGKNQIVVFDEEDQYGIGGETHGAVSHAIKHFKEFEPDKMKSGLQNALKMAASFDNYFLKNTKSGDVLATGDEAKKAANENAMLNTFDLINDKSENQKPLSPEEEKLMSILGPLNGEYQKLVDSYMSSGIDIEGTQDAAKIKQMLDAGKIVKFIGKYKDKPVQYFLNASDTGLVAYKDGKVATLFRIDKGGNNLSKVAKYFSRGVELNNPAFKDALASYAGGATEQPQQKKKEKPQQKKKAGAGDVVRRLKQANKTDDQIKQILSKAFPNLPEKAVANMLTNIKE